MNIQCDDTRARRAAGPRELTDDVVTCSLMDPSMDQLINKSKRAAYPL